MDEPTPRQPAPRRSRWHPRRLVRHFLILVIALGAAIGLNQCRLGRPLYLANIRVPRVVTRMPEPVAGQRIIVFAPHEDDEAIGCTNYIKRAVAAGAEVYIVLMTNGDATELSIFYYEKTVRRTPREYLALARIRQNETILAMRRLGVPRDHVIFLGYPNNGLDRLWSPQYWYASHPFQSPWTQVSASPYSNNYTLRAPYCGDAVVRDVRRVLTTLQPDTVFSVMPADIHRDHWPTWCFLADAIAQVQQQAGSYRGPAAVFTYLVHWPYWPAPKNYHPNQSMLPPAELRSSPDLHWAQLPVTHDEVVEKHQVISMYASQAGSWTPVVTSFARTDELFASIDPAVITEAPPLPGQEEETPAVPALTPVIEDTAVGSFRTIVHPDMDISQVSAAADARWLWLEVQTAHSLPRGASADVTVVPCVATGQSSAGPIELRWTRAAARPSSPGLAGDEDYRLSCTRAAEGQTLTEPPQGIHVHVDGPQVAFRIPRAWLNGAPAMIVGADTLSRGRRVDRAIWRLVYIQPYSAVQDGPLSPQAGGASPAP